MKQEILERKKYNTTMTSILQSIVVIVNIGISLTNCWEIPFCDDKKNGEILLDLSSIGIHRLRKSFASDPAIACLDLADNNLTSIEPEAFGSLGNLRSLNLSRNAIDFAEFCRLKKFKKLRTLVLDETIVSPPPPLNTEPPIFDYEDYVVYDTAVDERGYALGRIPMTVTRKVERTTTERPEFTLDGDQDNNIPIFPELESLSMSYYQRDGIVNALVKFGFMPNLTHLRVAGNKLTSIADLPLTSYPHLTHLNLDENEVNVFPGSTKINVSHLSMNDNKIEHLCSIYSELSNSMTPGAIKFLESLSLTNNLMTNIAADVFHNSESLMFLDLSNNSIESFPRHTFDNLRNLRDLVVNDNRLDRIPDICALENLRTLSLDGNRIIAIDETSFCNLPKLAHVSLRRNGLSQVAPGTFGQFPALSSLDLFGNKVASLPQNWIRSGIKLDWLNLDANEFVDLSSMSLDNLEDIGYLSIG